MCQYYYLHYHHQPPCAKTIEYELHYAFCERSTVEAGDMSVGIGTGIGAGMNTGGPSEGSCQLVQKPCDELTQIPDYGPAAYANPCMAGGCLISQHCASGGCRLDELGGRWECCQCRRGGNTFRWCVHPVRKVPDALCYHVVCRNCRRDLQS